MRKPYFGNGVGLAASNFEAAAGVSSAFGTFTFSNNWYSATMKTTAFAQIHRVGTTQIRLRFTKGDDGDSTADTISIYSGNYSVQANRPQLIVVIYVP